MSRKLLTLLAFCLATSGAAAQSATGKPAPDKAPPSPAASAPEETDLVPRAVFDVLLGEIALQRGNLPVALTAWVDLARRSLDPKALARAVEIASHTQQHDVALELARHWARIEPDSPPAQQALTTALALTNNMDELGNHLAGLLERDKANLAGNLMRLPRVFSRHPDKAVVQTLINRLAQPYVGVAEAHAAMAMAASANNDIARMRSEAEQAQQLRPDWEFAAILVAQALSKESNAQALVHLQTFVANNPGAVEARLTLARLLIAEKRYADGRGEFTRLLQERPADPDILYPSAMLALQEGDRKTGRELLERLLRTRYADKSSVHFFIGQLDEEDERPDDALGHYRQVVAGEQFLTARARTAQILMQQGKLEQALKSLRDAAGKTPVEKTRLIAAEAALLRDAKRHDEAFKVLDAAVRAQPDNAELLYEAAMAAEKLGKYELMETLLNKLIKQKPDHAHALNALGYSLADRNIRLDEAARLLNKASALAPKDPFIMDSLGWVQFRQGKLTQALATLEEAFRLRPDPEIAAHLGEVLWQLNRRDEALKVWKETAAKHPDNEALQAVIRRFAP